ncbi:MAG: DUF1292 domain-containing protein [Tenericutes bacterium]|nr:DUF1292 domain-containing protein [Mycoplasmatota bacterium]
MEENILNVTAEDGSTISVRVLDIIDSAKFNKSFIIYTVNGDDSNIFASILNESESSYSLDLISDEEEINYINQEIDRVVEEMKSEEN